MHKSGKGERGVAEQLAQARRGSADRPSGRRRSRAPWGPGRRGGATRAASRSADETLRWSRSGERWLMPNTVSADDRKERSERRDRIARVGVQRQLVDREIRPNLRARARRGWSGPASTAAFGRSDEERSSRHSAVSRFSSSAARAESLRAESAFSPSRCRPTPRSGPAGASSIPRTRAPRPRARRLVRKSRCDAGTAGPRREASAREVRRSESTSSA